MELDAVHGPHPVTQAHDDADADAAPPSSSCVRAVTSSAAGNPSPATTSEWYRDATNGSVKPVKTPRPLCTIVDVLPCIGRRRTDHVPSEHGADGLMTEADAQDRRVLPERANRDPS